MTAVRKNLEVLVGQEVVVDTDTSYLYIGTLDAVDEQTRVLVNADVHDVTDSPARIPQHDTIGRMGCGGRVWCTRGRTYGGLSCVCFTSSFSPPSPVRSPPPPRRR